MIRLADNSLRNNAGVDIVLLQLPFWAIDCPSLGLALLKSYLALHNISCRVIDINANAYCLRGKLYEEYWEATHGFNYSQDREAMLRYYKDNRALFLYYMGEINKLNPVIVGCSCKSSSFLLSQIFLEDLKNNFPRFKHILGGPSTAYFMKNAEKLLSKDYIDAVSLSEGEKSLVNYFCSLDKDATDPIAGLAYKKEGSIITGGPADFIKNLDELPFPDFSDFNFKHYISPNRLPAYTSRSCINRCIYCTARNYLKPFRYRSGKRIFDEIKYLKQQYPDLNYVRMCDDISNASIKELSVFCDLMIESKLGIKWNLENAVIRKEMRTPLYKRLRKAGCTLIGYGMETPSIRLLAGVGKVLAKDVDIARVFKEGKRAGIYISTSVMFGLPDEKEEDFIQLMNFLKKIHRYLNMVIPSITFCEFYPGSDGYANPDMYNIDLRKGYLFWESKDGSNTYPIRMQRFERFCEMAKKYKLDNQYNIVELPNKHKLLFNYYAISRVYDKALKEYDKISVDERTEEIKLVYDSIKNNKPIPAYRIEVKSLRNTLLYGRDFKETFAMTSLKEHLKNLEVADPFYNIWLKPWQQKLRRLAHRIIGYDQIDKKINGVYDMLNIIDEKIMTFLSKR